MGFGYVVLVKLVVVGVKGFCVLVGFIVLLVL